MQKNCTSKIDEFALLGVNVDEGTALKSYVLGFVDSSVDVDEYCPHNVIACGVAGKAERIENVQEYFNNNGVC